MIARIFFLPKNLSVRYTRGQEPCVNLPEIYTGFLSPCVVGAIENLRDLVPAGDAVFYLALALHHEASLFAAQRGFLLQCHHMLDSGILYAGNDKFFHNRCKVTKKSCIFARRIKKLASYGHF